MTPKKAILECKKNMKRVTFYIKPYFLHILVKFKPKSVLNGFSENRNTNKQIRYGRNYP